MPTLPIELAADDLAELSRLAEAMGAARSDVLANIVETFLATSRRHALPPMGGDITYTGFSASSQITTGQVADVLGTLANDLQVAAVIPIPGTAGVVAPVVAATVAGDQGEPDSHLLLYVALPRIDPPTAN